MYYCDPDVELLKIHPSGLKASITVKNHPYMPVQSLVFFESCGWNGPETSTKGGNGNFECQGHLCIGKNTMQNAIKERWQTPKHVPLPGYPPIVRYQASIG